MDILGQSALILGVTSFTLGISVLAKSVKNKLFLAFSGLTFVISGWALAFFLEKIWGSGSSYRWHLFFHVCLTPVALTLIHVLVRIQDRWSRRLRDASYLISFGLIIVLLFGMDEEPWIMALIYYTPVLVLLQILQLMWIDRKLKRGGRLIPKAPAVGLGKRGWIYLGGLVVLSTSVMDHVPWMGTVVPALGNLGLTGYLFFISRAITQQRLLNFGALLSRSLVLVAVALILTGLYSLMVGWIENSPALFILNSFISSFLLLMILDPLRSFVGYLTRRLLTQKHLQIEQILSEAQRKLTGVVDTSALFDMIFFVIDQTLQPQWAALFVLRRDGTKYRRVRISGPEPTEFTETQEQAVLKELLADHPLLQTCDRMRRRGELPILLDQIIESEIDRSTSRTQRQSLGALIQGLHALGSNMLIPLLDGGKILGFVVLKIPGPPEPWGNNWGLLGVVYPFFEQAAQTLRNMEVYVRQREKERLAALGEMAAGLAHEIRNPLGAIKGAAQYLDPTLDRPESRFLSVIIEEVDRLNRVVTQFLDYSKPNPGAFQSVDLSVLSQKTVELLRPSLSVPLKIEFQPSKEPARVMAAGEQLHQVLVNFIQNSIRALEGRTDPFIRVSVDIEGSGDHREVIASVYDNGRGIKKEHLDKIFIPFFTSSPSGTGLGLSICHKIIEAHRGRIDVLTEEGRFARFSVLLPYAKE